jgi:hypothetical protein
MANKVFGPILTNAPDVNYLWRMKKDRPFNAIKIVTQWGLDSGWNSLSRAQICALYPTIIVRTKAGDPSSNHPLPEFKSVYEEVAPWLEINPFAWLNIGNEMNIHEIQEYDIWLYKWHLMNTAKRIRELYPYAKLISPGFIRNEQLVRCVEIFRKGNNENAFDFFDYCGIHIYDHRNLLQPVDTQLTAMRNAFLYVNKPWFIAEFGVNKWEGNDAARIKHYLDFINGIACVGGTYFHICEDRKIYPQYHLV